MRIRCPHCRNPIDVVDESSLAEIHCPSCGSSFSLIGDDATQTHRPGSRRLAHFELVRELGIGKFGSVWVARDTELDRTVAIKIPRKGALDPQESELFLRDARAAAQLKHPHIVGVHEVGREDGTIYIVSDYVEGANLKEWLSGQKLSFRESAGLVVKVALALEHAHQAGVVHRDLKPGNIMVDHDGQPHVIDFGLAKRDAGEITMTLEGHILGTPAYMSPEQAGGKGHEADARSDVYSLGVILFELLTGELPFRGETQMLLVQIQRDEPPRPRWLNARIPRDLETIALKCLEKEPSRRYPTAQALADDLRHWLEGKPIVARPLGPAARIWRWAKRNPRVAVLSGSVFLLLTTVALGSTVAAIRIQSARRIADNSRIASQRAAERERVARIAAEQAQQQANVERERARQAAIEADRESRSAQQVADFLTNVFQGADPFSFFGSSFSGRLQVAPTTTVSELLDPATAHLADQAAIDPLVRARLLDTIGLVYVNMGRLEDGDRLIGEALTVRRKHLPKVSREIAASLSHRGLVKLVLGYHGEAQTLLEEALEQFKELDREQSLDAAAAMFLLGWNMLESGGRRSRDLAVQWMDRGVELRRELLGPDHPDVGNWMFSQSLLMMGLGGDQQKALSMFTKAIAMRSKQQGGETIAKGMQALLSGGLALSVGNKRGEMQLREGVRLLDEAYGASSTLMAHIHYFAAFLLRRAGLHGAAAETLEKATASARRLYGTHPRTTVFLVAQASALARQERLTEAAQVLLETDRIRASRLGEKARYGGRILNLWHRAEMKMPPDEAEEVLQRWLHEERQSEPVGPNEKIISACLQASQRKSRRLTESDRPEREIIDPTRPSNH